MKLQDLAKAPNLLKLTLDDDAIIEKYGEPLDFFIKDVQPVELMIELSKIATDKKKASDVAEYLPLIRPLLLNEDGSPVITDTVMLPPDVILYAITKTLVQLGKL